MHAADNRVLSMNVVVICREAAGQATWSVLTSAREKGWLRRKWVCCEAARAGRLEVLMWAVRSGCSVDYPDTPANAAGGGHLELLKWAWENGCPWNLIPAGGLRRAGTSRCSSRREPTNVPGTRAHAPGLPGEDTSECSSGRERTGARGTRTSAGRRRWGAISNLLEWAWGSGCPWDESFHCLTSERTERRPTELIHSSCERDDRCRRTASSSLLCFPCAYPRNVEKGGKKRLIAPTFK